MRRRERLLILGFVLASVAMVAFFSLRMLGRELEWESEKPETTSVSVLKVIKIDLDRPEDLAGWNRHSFHGETQYEIQEEPDGTKSLKAKSQKTCSAIFRAVSAAISEQPVISWQWKVKKFPSGKKNPVFGAGNESDYPARVSVIFKSDLPFQQDIVQYVWDDRFAVGTHGASPFWKKVKILVIRSGPPPESGEWVSEKRNIIEDYTFLFGKPPQRDIEAIGIMSDSDDTRSSTEAYLRHFEIQILHLEEDPEKPVRKKKFLKPLVPVFKETKKWIKTLFKIPTQTIPKTLVSTTKRVVTWPVSKAKALGENISGKEPESET